MVTKVADVRDIVKTGVTNPSRAFPVIKALAKSDDWVEREVSATALVEISKKQPDKVIAEMLIWSRNRDANVRRTASEGANKDNSLTIVENDKLQNPTSVHSCYL